MIKYNTKTINKVATDSTINKMYYGGDLAYQYISTTPSSRLPDGYTEVEYVENTGSVGLDLGVTANQDTRIVVTMQTVTDTNNGRLLGCGGYDRRDNGWQFNFESGSEGTLHISWGTIAGWTEYSYYGDYNVHEYDWDKNNFYVDKGTANEFSATTTYGTFETTDTIGLFCNKQNAYGGLENFWKGKCFSCKLYDDGTLIKDLIPCTRDSDSKAGMYDIVNNVFFYPPSGDLVAGNQV